jgi:hypothetical protein
VTKFITSLDRRLAEQTSSQAMAASKKPSGAYTLTEAYEAALRVQAVNVRLRIAREMAPRVGDVRKPRWGGKQAAAHMASPACSHAAHVPTDTGYPQLAAAGPAVAGGSGACHNCGETGHYKNGCPYPRRNSSGVNNQQGHARAEERGQPRACYVCGDINHLTAQCPKRAVPVTVAAAATGEGPGGAGSISAEDLGAFQEWKAMAQAAAAPPAEEHKDDGWDDYEYELGAVALPLEEVTEGLEFAAVATRAETEKARAKKKPRSEAALGPQAGVAAG